MSKFKSVISKKTKFFWLYFIAGALLLTLGVFLLPVWQDTSVFWKSWGSFAVNLIMFAAIFLYIVLFLSRQLVRERRESIRMLVVVEIVLFAIIGLGCILEQLALINIGGPCVILGLAIWIRGVIYVIKGYLYRHTAEEHRYTFAELAIAIAFVTFGAVLMARPFFTELHLMWIGAVAVIIAAIIAVVLGILSKPEKKAKSK